MLQVEAKLQPASDKLLEGDLDHSIKLCALAAVTRLSVGRSGLCRTTRGAKKMWCSLHRCITCSPPQQSPFPSPLRTLPYVYKQNQRGLVTGLLQEGHTTSITSLELSAVVAAHGRELEASPDRTHSNSPPGYPQFHRRGGCGDKGMKKEPTTRQTIWEKQNEKVVTLQ